MLTQLVFTKNISIYQKYSVPLRFLKNLVMPNTPATALPLKRTLGEKINVEDVEDLSKPERLRLATVVEKKLSKLKDEERDSFLAKIDSIMAVESKNSVWEHNHIVISQAVASLLQQHGIMPPINAIVEETGLSRQTVAKHLKEYKSHPQFITEIERFKFMSHNLLANVFNYAVNGDMKAARIYFEMIGAINKQQGGTVVNEQNNYIQINNTILSQENLKLLTAEQLDLIERMVNKQCKVLA